MVEFTTELSLIVHVDDYRYALHIAKILNSTLCSIIRGLDCEIVKAYSTNSKLWGVVGSAKDVALFKELNATLQQVDYITVAFRIKEEK